MTYVGWGLPILALVLLSVLFFAGSRNDRHTLQAWNARIVAFVWVCTVVVLSAVRQVRFPSDMAFYVTTFGQAPAYDSMGEFLAQSASDPGFSMFQYWLAQVSSDQRLLMGGIAFVICLSFWLAIRLVLPPVPAVVVLFVTSLFPFFAFYVANTARQGMAVALVVYALCAVCANTGRMRVLASLLLIAAVFVHLSAAPPAGVVVLMMVRVPSIKTSLWVWFACAMLYLTGMNARLMSLVSLDDKRLAQYSEYEALSGYAGGINRVDFFVLSGVLVFGVLWIHRRNSAAGLHGDERVARILVCSYLLFNSVFLCLGFLAYSDRTAAYSWLMTPLVVGYLLFRVDRPANALGRVAFVVGVCVITFATQGWPALLERVPIVG